MAQTKKTTPRKTAKSKATAKKTPAKKKVSPKRRATAPKAKSKRPAPKKTAPKKALTTAPKPGTTLTRIFKGKTYDLRVLADGFALGDVKFRTLTAAAKAVTTYPSISGPRFWLGTEAGSQSKGK